MRKIPLIKPYVGKEELEEVRLVLESGWLSNGPTMVKFEKALADYLGAPYVVSTSSCTTALSLALESLEVKPGAEVVVPDFTHPATANVVVRGGWKPVIADVRLDTYGISLEKVRKAASAKTKAMIIVHPFGHPIELDETREFCKRKGIALIEDAATAIGTKYKGKLIGGTGGVVCFSFHPRKLLTTGEGGALATDDPEVAQPAREFRSHGEVRDEKGSHFVRNGLNYRLSDVNAALGLAQLRKLDAMLTRRRKLAKRYSKLLRESKLDLTPPVELEYAYHTYQSYVVLLGKKVDRDAVKSRLKQEFGVETQVGTYALHLQKAFAKYRDGSLANGATLYRSTLTLPLYHELSESDQDFVVESLSKVIGRP